MSFRGPSIIRVGFLAETLSDKQVASRTTSNQSFSHVYGFIIADALPTEVREAEGFIKSVCPIIAGRHS
jgi:hypothetical protein